MCFGTSRGRRYRIGKRRVVAANKAGELPFARKITSTAIANPCLSGSIFALLPRSGHVLDRRWLEHPSATSVAFSDRYVMGVVVLGLARSTCRANAVTTTTKTSRRSLALRRRRSAALIHP
jgi:hypothetical protein